MQKDGQKGRAETLLKAAWDCSATVVKCHRACFPAPTGATNCTSETSTKAEAWIETWPNGSVVTGTAWCLCQRPRNRRCCPLRSRVSGWRSCMLKWADCSFHEVFLPRGISTLPWGWTPDLQGLHRYTAEMKTWILLCTKRRRDTGYAWSWGRWRKLSINKASQLVLALPSRERQLTLPHSLQTNAERGRKKDSGIMHVLPADTSPSHRILLGLVISKECLLRTCYHKIPC